MKQDADGTIKRCTQCILPQGYPGIFLDSTGACNFCRDHKRVEPLGKARFLATVPAQSDGGYDCVLGISGGKDSCYVAYLASRVCGLKALAVFYDFPFLRDLARDNARRVCESVGVELRLIQSKNEVELNLVRNHIKSLAATGTTWGQCIFCHYGIDAVLDGIARSEQIPFVLSGTTSNELWWNPGDRKGILAKRLRRLPPVELAKFGFYQFRAFCGLVEQRRQFPLEGNRKLDVYSHPTRPEGGPEFVKVFDYFPWDQREIEQVLVEEAGWVKPEKTLTWRYDCILEPLLDYTYLKEWGVSTVGLYLSGLIRNGLLTRDEALAMQKEAEDPEYLRQGVEHVFDFLEIPQRDREKFFSA